MNLERKIIVASLAFSLVVWVVDSVLDTVFFYGGNFLDLLILNIPPHEIYFRILVVAVFLIFGIVIARLVSARSRVEESLRESEEKYRMQFEESLDGVAVADAETGILVDCNRAFEKLTGRSQSEIIGLHQSRLHAPDDIENGFSRTYRQHLQGKSGEVLETKIVTKAGQTRDASIKANLFEVRGRKFIQGIFRDITDRKQAEILLRESEERYRLLVETSPYAIAIHQDEKIVFANLSAAKLFGAEDPRQLIGRSITEVIHPDGLAVMANRRDRLLAGETDIYPVEDRYIRLDGTVVPVEVTIAPFTYKGRPAIQAIVLDITDRKLAEKSLQESHQRLLTILDAIDAHIYVADFETYEILYVNKKMQADFQQTLVGQACWRVFRGEAGPCANCTNHRLLDADGQPTGIHVWEGQNPLTGNWYINYDRAIQWTNNRLVRIQIAMDFTDRKLAEEALIASERKFRSYIDNAPDGIFVANERGQYVDVNNAACRITGYTKAELLGKNLIDLIPVEDHPTAAKHFRAVVETGYSSGDVSFFRKDGAKGFWTIDSVKLSDSRFLGFAKDITERKKLELQLRQAQKMEAIGHLAGGVAHDFNNLLTVINGYSELVLNRLSQNDPGFSELRQIREAGNRAQALTRQLLAFSRKQILQPQVLDLNQLLGEMSKMLRRLIGEDIALLSVYSPDLKLIRADPSQLEQVILNLAVNARDAMPNGGRLTLETRNVYLDDTYIQNHPDAEVGPYVMLAISDNGQGMDSETLTRIFDPFFTTKEVGKGTGLGLATVYGIVKQSGGSIYVYSEPGKGTTFKIYLKALEQAKRAETAGAQPVEIAPGGTETVLVVEDEEPVRDLVVIVLKKYGYAVVQAINGQEAMAHMEQTRVDMLLTDVIMPGVSGRVVAQRALAVNPSVKILYMSGYTDNAIVHHGVLDEDANFIQKPFSPLTLLKKIRQVLDGEIKSSE